MGWVQLSTHFKDKETEVNSLFIFKLLNITIFVCLALHEAMQD